MPKLHVLENTELSEYCLNILEKHDIRSVREFIVETHEKLMKVLNLNFEQVKTIKKKLVHLHGPQKMLLSDKLRVEKLKLKVYGTNISTLDHILGNETLHSLSFWEISGSTGVGKTQLALTLVINFIINQNLDALYIDTKLDFSAGRIKSMLKARKIEAEVLVGIMSSIKVERVFSAQGVVEMLECLYEQLKQGNPDIVTTKLVIIDSLPAVWFLLKAKSNLLPGKWLLSRLSQIINRLVQDYYITVICVNLSLLSTLEENETKSNSLTTNNENDVSKIIDADDIDIALGYRPVLGHCWLNKPRIRLSMEFPATQDDNDSSVRVINVLKSSHSFRNVSCLVKIQDEGVVGLE